MQDPLGALATLDLGDRKLRYFSLPRLEQRGLGPVSRLPVSLRIVLESLVRNLDGARVREEDVRALCAWKPRGERTAEVPFVVARVLLQDFTGVPLLVDLAAMRSAMARLSRDPRRVEPVVPVDLVVDHSVQVDAWGSGDALERNLAFEMERNRQRYEFLKWGAQAFHGFRIVPPGFGICHQVNLELLARGVWERDGVAFPDTLVGTDSHTTMVNGLGIVGWGVGGIEAEAAMLGQPSAFLTPDVVGVHLHGALRDGATATDLVLAVTELLRRAQVVGKFVEFHGEGARALPAATRATVANMAPEYGATLGFFPSDERTLRYLEATGRAPEQVRLVRAYLTAQGLFGIPARGQCDYSEVVDLDLAGVEPSVAGPKRPQDRIALTALKAQVASLLPRPEPAAGRPTHGDVVVAAITSCTNTSNPAVMVAAGLLARKAAARGLRPPPWVKTSLAPGSRVVTEYLTATGLQQDLDALGFQTVGYGCTTCIGNSGPLDAALEQRIAGKDLVVASVLSGNRNFEARIHPAVRANFLMSPPLVVAFALAGTVDLDLDREPLGRDRDGRPVFLRDLWPSPAEVEALLGAAGDPERYRRNYASVGQGSAAWQGLSAPAGVEYRWDAASTYVREPPYFEGFSPRAAPAEAGPILGARALAVLGDSVTTDHISPAGNIDPASPAGQYLRAQGVSVPDFNSYGARRGNHEVMVRGTFANVRIRNLMVPGIEGGVTVHQPSGDRMSIHAAAVRYGEEGVPLLVIAGQEYGTGSSRDWAAKGTRLLGVRAVVARSFERIHRGNLVGMGVLPLQLPEGVSAGSLGLDGTERYDLSAPEGGLAPRRRATLTIARKGGREERVPLTLRIDTPIEVEYFRHGGILPFVLRELARGA
ncbi:MAG TPA: aconitate hydratase AcnA [Anaeromyxobacteraceae bacterium]|nr:aconitate hydratase AcnA [Anaeromyxobacteraceae bacterium]